MWQPQRQRPLWCQGYAYLSDETRKIPLSTISETSTERTKYDDTTNDNKNLFPSSDNELTTLQNQKNKALTRSSPSGRQKKSKK